MAETSRKQKNTPTGDFQIVTFFLSQEEFGVDILLVQEIIRPSPVTEVPNTPQFVEGVINLRGKVVPVIDLRKRLNIPATEVDKATRIIIIELEKRVTGFVVDSVSKVITVPAASVQSAPDMIMSGVESEYITGVSRIDDRLIILLDFSKILTAGEQRQLAELS
jgi:purine-binding chemotaxis protein CheW